MPNIFLDGFSAFQNHFWIIVYILLVVIWGWLVTQKILIRIFADYFTDVEYFSLSSAGWIFPVIFWAGLFFCINFLFGKITAIIFSIILFIIPFLFSRIKRISISVIGLVLFFIISLFLRFAILEKTTLPFYFDSAEHYRLIKYLLGVYQKDIPSNSLLLTNYYHVGYHFLLSSIVYLFQLNISHAMLVFGQIVLAILPISFFFLLKQITKSNTVAFLTCLIAAFGFHMPAHMVNWGKYPALLSLFGIQFIFSLGYLVVAKDLTQTQKSKIYWLIALSILLTALIHTRTLIIFLLLATSLFIAYQIKKMPIRSQYFSFIFLFIIFGIEIYYIAQNPALSPLITGYTQRDVWSLILVLLMIPFSIKPFPNLVYFLLTTLCLSMFFLFLPISLFNYGTQTLLDRPFVQMLAYISLSIIVGLGFAGLIQITQKLPHAKFVISFILFVFVIANTKINHDFYPSDCCQLVSHDDLSAISWIDKTLSTDATILIASSRLYVTSYESAQTQAGADAGIWITPLTSRVTALASAELNFEFDNTHIGFCSQNIAYIYIGSMPQSFNETQLVSQPSLYQPVFLLPNARVYQVIGCD